MAVTINNNSAIRQRAQTGKSGLLPVMSLWIGNELSPLERLSMASFVAHGHPYRLYSYTKFDNVPDGVEQLDAREILPEENIFIGDKDRGYATFSDWFRWELLSRYPGWWSDTDMICLKPLDLDGELVAAQQNSQYAGAELAEQYVKMESPKRKRHRRPLFEGPLINSALVKCVNPSHPVVKRLRRFCAKPEHYYLYRIRHGNRVYWSALFGRILWRQKTNARKYMRKVHGTCLGGPWALTDVIVSQKAFAGIQPYQLFYPVPWQAAHTLLDDTYAGNNDPFPDSYAVHVWNTILESEQGAKGKLAGLTPESFLGRLLREYQI